MTLVTGLAQQKQTLAPGMIDVRGWEIRTLVDDAVAGSVHDLLLDGSGLVRWLDLALDDVRHVLFPAGQGRADQRRRCIWLPGLAADQLAQLPAYAHEAQAVDPALEARLLAAYAAVLLREAPDAEPGLSAPAEASAPVNAAAPSGDARLDAHALFPWVVD